MMGGDDADEDQSYSQSSSDGSDWREKERRRSLLGALEGFDAAHSIIECITRRPSDEGDKPGTAHVSTLAVLSLVALIEADTSTDPEAYGSDDLLEDTCYFLIDLMQRIYRAEVQQASPVDPAAKAALQRALSVRLDRVSFDDKDGCENYEFGPDEEGEVSDVLLTSPFAKFHEDEFHEDTKPRAVEEAASKNAIELCRATCVQIEDENDAFYDDEDSPYFSNLSSHDGLMGFVHTGGGHKYREFLGYLYYFDAEVRGNDRGFRSWEVADEFWNPPREIFCDSQNDVAWVRADERIKGFAIRRRREGDNSRVVYTKYIFNIASNPKPTGSLLDATRKKLLGRRPASSCSQGPAMFSMGNQRLGCLTDGYLQEWKLDEGNLHDGTRRLVNNYSIEEQIAAAGWRPEDVLNLQDTTWMDDCGKAEITRGIKPDSIRHVDIRPPSSVGYLSGGRLAFANSSYDAVGQIPIYDQDLRETCCLVGFGGRCCWVNIVQRPTFAEAGDENTFVASDHEGAKVFDLRSGMPVMKMYQEHLSSSTPVHIAGAKYVCNHLGSGGAMMWDLPMDSFTDSVGRTRFSLQKGVGIRRKWHGIIGLGLNVSGATGWRWRLVWDE
ncbi:hypothetical protein ACHAXT_009029 [Thalassiosira profunda]